MYRANRTFLPGDTEPIQDIRINRGNTGFSRHILNTGHSYNSIEDTMTILKVAQKKDYTGLFIIPWHITKKSPDLNGAKDGNMRHADRKRNSQSLFVLAVGA
jgi:hypothetical protein